MALLRRGWGVVILGLVLLLGVYAATRLYNLTIIPIFTDEAIYIRWSQIGAQDANWRFISLVDGKQPMYTWVTMGLLRLFQGYDPLWVGRLTSVLAGAVSLVGMWVLTWELFRNKKLAFLATILYLVSPFTLLYDRMALYDSMVATFSIWSLYLAVLLARRVRLDVALILGMVLGGGMLNKTSGFLSLYMLPGTLLLFDWAKADRWKKLLRWVGLALVAAVVSQMLYSILRLSPLFHMIAQKDNVFVFTVGEFLNQPFRFLQGNMQGMFDWVRTYMTLPLFVLAVLAVVYPSKSWREKLLLFGWFLAPFVALASFGKVLYPRFVLFMTMPMLILAAVGLAGLMRRVGRWAPLILAAVLVWPIYTDYLLLTAPTRAPITTSDKNQYILDWPSGGGVREANAFFAQQATMGKITVVTEGTFGLMPYAVEIYLVDHPNVEIIGIWPVPEAMPEDMLTTAQDHPVYFLTFQRQEAPPGWPLRLVAEYEKGIPTVKLRVYEVIPE
jgi:4-amino-4-deoxy-L-arabinose transferase-like glycosyltransferase